MRSTCIYIDDGLIMASGFGRALNFVRDSLESAGLVINIETRIYYKNMMS